MTFPRYEFINVPLEIEYSIGTHWGSLIETGTVKTTEFSSYNKERNSWEEVTNPFISSMYIASRKDMIQNNLQQIH